MASTQIPTKNGRQTLPLTNSNVRDTTELCALAARGLVPMFDRERQLFCDRLNQTPQGLVSEGISPRYSIMTLLGLHQYKIGGGQSSEIPVEAATERMLTETAWADNIGDMGLTLWLSAVIAPERLTDVYQRLGLETALDRMSGAQAGSTMETAWFLAGLAHAALAGGRDLPDLVNVAEKTRQILMKNQGRYGTFGHLNKTSGIAGAIRGRIGSFADQVYPIYALAKFGTAFQDQKALENAKRCAEAICAAQGTMGQWWWHYDTVTGRVIQRYPVYSVHQHAMGPMALFALSDAAGIDFSAPIYKGLAWIDGNNELRRDMRDTSANLVWRCVHRPGRSKMYLREFVDFVSAADSPRSINDLRIRHECRPYELGWLLYAFGTRTRP